RGTNCGLNGCTMAQAFPAPPELAALLNSRANATRSTTDTNPDTNPFAGLSSCVTYARDPNAGMPGHTPQAVSANGVAVTFAVDPNTGLPVYNCGSNAPWAFNSRFDFIP